ncbi:hypothetical protein GCM10009119_22040 [Algoriphagus jejuensis]|uniref:Glycosyl hydrolase family 43 n=1 Tax=Algoriphagus jejuensis TaxID=419934 RepID=A0ABP3YCV8_9BACT
MRFSKNTSFGITLSVILLACLAAGMPDKQLRVEPKPVAATLVKGESDFLQGPSVLKLDDYFVWGATVVQGEDGKYHMVFSLWESGPEHEPFNNSWVLESKLGYAVSDYPDRDFKFQKIILKGAHYDGNAATWDAQSVHNPHLRKFGDKYYLYYIGGRDAGEGVAPDLDQRARVQQSLQIGVIEFSSFEDLLAGRFERPAEPLLSPRSRVKANQVLLPSPPGTEVKPDNLIVVNPSVDYNPNTGEYMLFFKGNIYEPHWKGVHGVATSKSPTGPFVAKDQFIFDVKMPDGSFASAEDPYVWYSKAYGRFFAVVKDFTGRISGGNPKDLAILESKDGLDWRLGEYPQFLKPEVTLADGSLQKLNRLERPQLLVDKRGIPRYLYAAAAVDNVNAKKDGSSFNIHIPLKIN